MAFLNALPGAIAEGLIWGLMAIGVYISYKVLDIADLTVDGSICTGACVCAMLIAGGCPVLLAVVLAFLAGVVTGVVTGLLHTIFGIPSILAGILTQLGLYSVNLKIMGGSANKAISVDKYDLLVSLRHIKNVPFYQNTIFITIIILLVLIGILYWFFGTELGCSIRATGSNERMACAQGINTNFRKVMGLMISNGIVAFASALYAQYQGFADVNAGRGAIVIGLAAVIIGEVAFSKLRKNFACVLGTVALGAIVYYVVIQIVLWLGLDSNYLKLLSAAVVAIFLAVPVMGEKWNIKRSYKEGGNR